MTQDFIDNKPMLRISFGGEQFILPWREGVQILNLMREAQGVETKYEKDTYKTYWVRGTKTIVAESFSPESQARLLME